MTKPSSRAGNRGTRSFAWLIILSSLAVFAVGRWVQQAMLSPTKLEAMVAANEPEEHVHALAGSPGDVTWVGTHLGLLAGRNGRNWTRVPGISGDVLAIHPIGVDLLYLGGKEIGVSKYAAGHSERLLQGEVLALTVDPSEQKHMLAYQVSAGLQESLDGGKSWSKVADFSGAEVLSVAIDPKTSKVIVAGGINGLFTVSADGGKTWNPGGVLQGTVSALVFEQSPPHRLWAAAGGQVRVSDDRGSTWRVVTSDAGNRTVVALGLAPESGGLLGLTAEGYLFKQSQPAPVSK